MILDLPLLFAIVLAFAVAMYVVTDGFDLGVGILFPLAPSDDARDTMMNSIAPFWDGNETWLIYGGVLLLAAFPLAYAALLPALYVPIVMMLFALIFRGIAFEFRFRATRGRFLWDWSFAAGSTLAAFCQGATLGAVIDGAPERSAAGIDTTWGFLTPFATASGLGLVAGYALLGATWLGFRAAGAAGEFGRKSVRPALLLMLLFIGIVSLWTPLAHPAIARRWFSFSHFLFLWPVPLVTAALAFLIWRTVESARGWLPFAAAILLFMMAFAGLGISLFPYVVPYRLTLWQAASSVPTLKFIGVGVCITLPISLFYLGYAHWVFRGKATSSSGYGDA